VAGAGWFANFRLYERDKNALREELTSYIKTEMSQESSNIHNTFKTLKTELDESAIAAAKKASAAQESKIKKLHHDILTLKLDVLHQEAKSFRQQELHGSELTAWKKMFSLALEIGWDFKITNCLEGMVSAMKAGGKATSSEVTEIFTMLDQLPKEYILLSDRVRSLLSTSIME